MFVSFHFIDADKMSEIVNNMCLVILYLITLQQSMKSKSWIIKHYSSHEWNYKNTMKQVNYEKSNIFPAVTPDKKP